MTGWGRFDLFKDYYPLSVRSPVLSQFGLPVVLPYGKFEAEFIPHSITRGIYRKIKMVNPCEVKGGLPIAFINECPVINFKVFGKGKIIAIGNDRIFAKYIIEKDSKVINYEQVQFLWNIINYLANE